MGASFPLTALLCPSNCLIRLKWQVAAHNDWYGRLDGSDDLEEAPRPREDRLRHQQHQAVRIANVVEEEAEVDEVVRVEEQAATHLLLQLRLRGISASARVSACACVWMCALAPSIPKGVW